MGIPSGRLLPSSLSISTYSSDRTGLVRVGFQLQMDTVQPFFEMLSERLHGLPVYVGSTPVGPDASIRLVKVLQSVHLVDQAKPCPHSESLYDSAESSSVAVASADFPGVSGTRAIRPRPSAYSAGRSPLPAARHSRMSVPPRISARRYHSHQPSFVLLSLRFRFSSPLRINTGLLTRCCRSQHRERPLCFPLQTVTGVHRHKVHRYYGLI